MAKCPSLTRLNRYMIGNCTSDDSQKIENHIAECEKCRQKVDAIDTNGPIEKQSPAQTNNAEDNSEQIHRNQAESPTMSMPGISSFLREEDVIEVSDDSTFDNYEIIEELPKGGQAVVYKATHIPTKTTVAIKVLLPSLLPSARARYYFEREAELIARLDHPGIVKIRDSGITHGQYFFVMEYIDGQPLNRYVKLHKLSFRERVILFNKVCTAVTYAHQQGIIHRDLKFGNIIIDERGEPHVLDFGLAKAIGLSEQAGNDAMATITGQWAGSLSNMSPEQAAGQPDLIDVRTDVYSLGVILYHMLTDRYPYDISGSTLEVLQNIQKNEPVRPRQLIPKFDADVEAILLAALSKERSQRYQSNADLQNDIENWLHGLPIRVRSISTIYLLRKIITRHRYASGVVGLLIVIILSFLYVSLNLYFTARQAQRKSEVIAKQWSDTAAEYLASSRQLIFSQFMQNWHEGDAEEAIFIANVLAKGSKEKTAAIFLLDPRPLAVKEPGFRQQLSEESAWFADFVIAEYKLKDGERSEAIESYQRSYAAVKEMARDKISDFDTFLSSQLKSRLYELSAAESQ